MLEQQEFEAETTCGACGAIIIADDDRNYVFSSTGELCWDCALARGGRWDAETEQWTLAPHVEDLLPPYAD